MIHYILYFREESDNSDTSDSDFEPDKEVRYLKDLVYKLIVILSIAQKLILNH